MEQPKSKVTSREKNEASLASPASDVRTRMPGIFEGATSQTLFVYGKSAVTVICESCGKTKTLAMEEYGNLPSRFRARCPCGATFDVFLDKRASYRKTVRLSGDYSITPDSKPHSRMVVESLSFKGVGFQTDGAYTLEVGDILNIAFTLDDETRSVIRTKVVVQNVKGDLVGVEYLNLDSNSKRALGFYLLVA